MKKSSSLLLGLVCVGAFASNAMAADSLYKAGDKAVYAGYSSLTDVSIPVTGFKVGGEYFFMDSISLGIEGNFLSEAVGATTFNYTNINGLVGYHGSLSDMLGVYMKAGYGSTGGTTTGGGTLRTLSGFVYEIGIESRFSSNIAGHLGYKSISVTSGGATASMGGITGGIDFIF